MAYIDPGNGAYMVQVLFTLVGAALFYVRHPIRTLKLIWQRLFGGAKSDPEAAADAAAADAPISAALGDAKAAGPSAQSDGGA